MLHRKFITAEMTPGVYCGSELKLECTKFGHERDPFHLRDHYNESAAVRHRIPRRLYRWQDSNLRPEAPKAPALPLSYTLSFAAHIKRQWSMPM